MATDGSKFPIYVEEDVMAPKAHGTAPKPVMKNLRWNVNYDTADRISCFNRHYAEHSGYWETTDFLNQVSTTISVNIVVVFLIDAHRIYYK